MPKPELVDVEAKLRAETPKAYKIDDGKTVDWVPKSAVEKNDNGTFTMPYWMAFEKGFI